MVTPAPGTTLVPAKVFKSELALQTTGTKNLIVPVVLKKSVINKHLKNFKYEKANQKNNTRKLDATNK